MSEQSQPINDGQKEKVLWPERFIVEVNAPKWQSNGSIFRDQRIICHQQCMPGKELKDLLEILGITPDGMDVDDFICKVKHAAMTFNEEQANKIVEYLCNRWRNHEDVTAWKRSVTPSILAEINSLDGSFLPCNDLHRLSWDREYDLEIEVLARFEIDNSRIVGIANEERI